MKLRGGVDAHDPALLADQPRDLLRGVAKPAAEIEHALSSAGREQLERRFAVRAETGGHDLAEAHEAVIQRPVPRLDRLGVGLDRGLRPDLPRCCACHAVLRRVGT